MEGTLMSIEGHLDALKRKHGALESQLNEMMSRPVPDQATMSMLKREKLRLKEEIMKLSEATQAGETRH
ncbi:MAG: DUF465 domain-containing protein [Pseudomonadota bacterium]